MHTRDANHHNTSQWGWHLYAQYPLSLFSPDPPEGEAITVQDLSQTLHELGLPPENAESIYTTLRKFQREAQGQAIPGMEKPPGHVRIFCQKEMLDQKVKGGCGCFILDRYQEAPAGSSQEPVYWIDIYLYEES